VGSGPPAGASVNCSRIRSIFCPAAGPAAGGWMEGGFAQRKQGFPLWGIYGIYIHIPECCTLLQTRQRKAGEWCGVRSSGSLLATQRDP